MKNKEKKPKQTKQEKAEALENLRQENFCHYYLFGVKGGKDRFRMGNGTLSYLKAFQLNKTKHYNMASVESHKLLRKPKIKKRLQELLESAGFNDHAVDARLNEIIFESSDKNSNVAIKTYNELQKRINTNPNVVIVNPERKEKFSKAIEFLHGNKK